MWVPFQKRLYMETPKHVLKVSCTKTSKATVLVIDRLLEACVAYYYPSVNVVQVCNIKQKIIDIGQNGKRKARRVSTTT